MKHHRMFLLAFLALLKPVYAGETKAQWQIEWEKTLAAAYREGEVTIYGRVGTQHVEVFDGFKKSHPQIKLSYIQGGGQNVQRIFAERRAGKYLVDVSLLGAFPGFVLFQGDTLDPIPPALILPENRDPSLWFGKRHLYADPRNEYVFIMVGNVDSTIAAYNTQRVSPKEVSSYWDLLHPRWKGKIVVYDPTAIGHAGTWRALYYNPRLGKEFIRRLLSEMDVTVSRDQRQMLDWIAKGTFLLALPVNGSDVLAAKKQGLLVDLLEAPLGEGLMSSAAGQVVLMNKAPHPNAAKVLINWLLSREGQIELQKKTDYNSLRKDIPKGMLSNPRVIPKDGVEYLNPNLPQYADGKPLLEVVRGALAKGR